MSCQRVGGGSFPAFLWAGLSCYCFCCCVAVVAVVSVVAFVALLTAQ